MAEECLICKAPLEYLESAVPMECAVCHKKEPSRARCVKGHYVCDECHTRGLDSILGPMVPEDMVPDELKDSLQSDEYKMMLILSEYKVASDEVNAQCEAVSGIVKSYDPEGMVVGEAPCTLDLIRIMKDCTYSGYKAKHEKK